VVGYQEGLGNVLWEDRTMIGLDGSDLGEITPAAINNRGQIVGTIPTAIAGEPHAALWESGTIVDLGVLPGDSSSSARAINNRGGPGYLCL
jgi:probable HAF family extracellular repeat protein